MISLFAIAPAGIAQRPDGDQSQGMGRSGMIGMLRRALQTLFAFVGDSSRWYLILFHIELDNLV
ncbi:MAG: hypothetical protein WAW96_08215 [Alphaproteobacteria bacterium]